MRWWFAVLAASGCGRVGFQAREQDAAVDAPADVSIDAPPIDAPLALLIVPIEVGPHHMGDTGGGGTPPTPEGGTWSGGFVVTTACATSTLEMDFFPPWGPSPTPNNPTITVDSIALASVTPFFVCNAGSCDFASGIVHVSLAAQTVMGANTLAFNQDPSDDYFWGNAELHCWH